MDGWGGKELNWGCVWIGWDDNIDGFRQILTLLLTDVKPSLSVIIHYLSVLYLVLIGTKR